MRRFRLSSSLASLLALSACGGGETTMTDPDAGTSMPDAYVEVDGGPVDPTWDCTETGVDVYTPPDHLFPFDATRRGQVVRCGADDALSVETVRTRAAERDYTGPELTTGASVTRVLYRTERGDGSGGFSSGTLYLPEGASDLPLMVHVSGTTGLADMCAPSRQRFQDIERTVYPLIGSGHAVFVPDLLGLGTPGPYAWLEPIEAAHSVLDGARAALAIAPDGALSGSITISGHSAGGHAALSAQALQRAYAPELDVLGVSAVAAVWFDTSIFGVLMSQPDYSIADPDDGWNVVYGAMYFIGHTVAYDGEARGYEIIEASRRSAVQTLFETSCLSNPDGTDLRTGLAAIASTVNELFDPTIRNSLSMCAFFGICEGPSMPWPMRWMADRPPLDAEGAPIWFHQGTLDNRSTVESMNCPIRNAGTAGVDVTACIYEGVEHGPIAAESAEWLGAWADALGSGGAAPACPDPTPLPDPASPCMP